MRMKLGITQMRSDGSRRTHRLGIRNNMRLQPASEVKSLHLLEIGIGEDRGKTDDLVEGPIGAGRVDIVEHERHRAVPSFLPAGILAARICEGKISNAKVERLTAYTKFL